MPFERGFKSWSENVSLQVRNDLGLKPAAPLSATSLAEHLQVPLWTPEELDLSSDDLQTLLFDETASWSAMTISCAGRSAVIYNSSHGRRRRSSDIMHELAHLVIGHDASKIFLAMNVPLVIRSFDRQQEDEATWLSGCLLLPRSALLAIAKSGMGHGDACEKYKVSQDLLTYRLNVTGVTNQVKHRRRRAAAG